MKKWYSAPMGNHQGLIIEEKTGDNIAVSYKKENAPLLAAAPELLEVAQDTLKILDNLTTKQFEEGGDKELRRRLYNVIADATE